MMHPVVRVAVKCNHLCTSIRFLLSSAPTLLTFSHEKLTSSMELSETELKSRAGSLGHVHAQGRLLNPAASLQYLPYYFYCRDNTIGWPDAEFASSSFWEYHLQAPPGLMLD